MFVGLKTLLKRGWAAIEPWYDWGAREAWRLDCTSLAEADLNEFRVRYVELQWFGIYVELRFGRVPAKVAA